MKNLLLLFLCLFCCNTITNLQAQERTRDKRTPFPKVIYQNDEPFVEYEGKWVKLLAIEKIPVSTFIGMAKEQFPTQWKKGFHRYWHYLMDDLQLERGETVIVRYEQNGEVFSKAFPLDRRYRDLATDYHEAQIQQQRIDRPRATDFPKDWAYLVHRIDGKTAQGKDFLSRAAAEADLAYLEWEIEQHYAYATLRGFDYRLALDLIRQHLGEGISRRDLAYQLKMLLANFGDGHTRVSIADVIPKAERRLKLPFVILEQDGNFYAVDASKKDFYDQTYPQLKAINGVSVAKLLTLAKQLVAKTTQGFQRRTALSYLRYIAFILKMADRYQGEDVQLSFVDDTGREKELSLRLGVYAGNRFAHQPERLTAKLLPNQLGYLALRDKMYDDDEFLSQLDQAMQTFKSTQGLIIDLRGNGGGSRAALRRLLPYFIKTAKVTNVARYRIDQEQDFFPRYGYLGERYMLPAYWYAMPFTSREEQEAIEQFQQTVSNFTKSFEPKRKVEEDKFSAYHYMVVRPDEHAAVYYYDRPVIVLIDEACFSATDIFAAGMKTGDQVRLLGRTTGGGSGFAKRKYLPNAKLNLRLSRFFSYQPNGELYDGQGVVPDIVMANNLSDQMRKTDLILTKAIEILSANK